MDSRTQPSNPQACYAACCKHCGKFFIEEDSEWPFPCEFGEEHETLEEIGLARANDWLGSEILEAFARLVRQERHNLARLAEVQERRAFVAQRIAQG